MVDTPHQDHRVPERGYGMGYQEAVKIDVRANFGMNADEYYRRQVGLMLDKIPESLTGESGVIESRTLNPDFKLPDDDVILREKAKRAGVQWLDRCNLNLGSSSRVLDLAAGEGDTSRYLATTGARVESSDYEQDLVDAGVRREAELRRALTPESTVDAVRARIHQNLGQVTYSRADYGDVKKFLPSAEDNQYDTIAVLSRSFVYLGERENYEKALKDFYDLLKPGGKVAIQARDSFKSEHAWGEEVQARMFYDQDGNCVSRDETTGVEFVWEMGSKKATTLSDGIEQATAKRHLRYPDGTKKDLGSVTYDEHLRLKNIAMWAEMLKKAGFKNIGLKVERLTSNESVLMYAIVAEKP
jgi:SAM-dependent methyltransferase